ncbi:MAG: hypothetical protein LIO71_00575, partial [Ruminococcus sp.]|nr:hypothetical protein [Ruminococcus sp.]
MKDKPTNNSNVARKSIKKGKKRYKARLSQKGLATIVIFILIILAIVITLVTSFMNKNNIDRVSSRLDLSMGKSISEIEKTAKVEFNQSASNAILSNLIKFNYIAEPTVTTRVCGVSLPRWVVYAKTNKSGNTTQFTIYDFTTLEDNILGMKVKEPIEIQDLIGTSADSLKDVLDIDPYISIMLEDGSKQYIFRYYYKDSTSTNDVSIQLCIDVDVNGTVIDATE